MSGHIQNGSQHHLLNETSPSILCANLSLNDTFDNCTNVLSSSSFPLNNLFPNSLVIIFVLSLLSISGVCFMIFGPLQRSEAYKRVENFTFGRHPIFNVDHHEVSTAGGYEESMEFIDE